jgi:oxygen-independent coproporphyrinogen-3 oxidase
MMNQLRLFSSFTLADFQQSTGLDANTILPTLTQAKQKGLMSLNNDSWQVTPLGHRYLNDLLELFL